LPRRIARPAGRDRSRSDAVPRRAKEIKANLDAEGVGDMPWARRGGAADAVRAQKAGIEVRDGQQVMLEAREVKNIDS